MSASEYRFADHDAEIKLAADLKHYGRRVFDGRTDLAERRHRVRAAIIAGNLAKRVRRAHRGDAVRDVWRSLSARVSRTPATLTTRGKPSCTH